MYYLLATGCLYLVAATLQCLLEQSALLESTERVTIHQVQNFILSLFECQLVDDVVRNGGCNLFASRRIKIDLKKTEEQNATT